jgi:type IV pilus assembly protein PilE
MGKKSHTQGFSLVELTAVIAIISILVAIALPQYNAYMLKGKLAEAMSLLSDLQIREEQYYQDNRTYSSTMVPKAAGTYFTNTTCVTANSGQTFTCTAAAPALSYTYTISESGAKATTKPDGSTVNCWLKSSSGSC